jgi:Helicase conserved C-terminal domain
VSVSNRDYALAVPINALVAFGFGQAGRLEQPRMQQLEAFQKSSQGIWATVESAGKIGRRLLSVISSLGGAVTADQLAFHTPGAEPGVIDEALDRLANSALLVRTPSGGAVLTPAANSQLSIPSISLADINATTSDALAQICRSLALVAPAKKQERIDAIAQLFADEAGALHVTRSLSPEAFHLLNRIADVAGPGVIESDEVGISGYLLRATQGARYAQRPSPLSEIAALIELTSRGIVGVAEYDRTLWIWREAWPLVARPFYQDWTTPPAPRIASTDTSSNRLPSIVAVLDQLLRLWAGSPPATLKNGSPRIAKSDVKASAKSLGVDEAVVDLASRLAIGIGLLRRNTTGVSGRGRNQRSEQAWMGDPTMVDAWAALAPTQRWVRLVAEWFTPDETSEGDLTNRHLTVWQLSLLDPSDGYVDADTFVSWFAHRHSPMTSEPAIKEALADLGALGVVAMSGPIALTALGRLAIEDPESISSLLGGAATGAVVQGDLSIIAPPDLRADLTVRLESLALVESSSGAVVYRLDPSRVTRAVQAGDAVDDVIGFLAALSPVPLPDTVVRLVRDAGSKAGTVRVVAASTVVIVTDPADLVTACSIKAIQLTRISDTVAVTEVALGKVRTALERKGLTPETLISAGKTEARSSAAEAVEAAKRAAEYRAISAGRGHSYYEREAEALDARAKSLTDTASRLAVRGPLAATPAVLERMASEPAKSTAKAST